MSSLKVRRIGVLASGRGSNLAALLSADLSPASIVCVLSDKAAAPALDLARQAGVEVVQHLAPKPFAGDRAAYDASVTAALREAGVDFVCLAGYMRLVSPGFVADWRGRMINIHPSLLPSFKGLDAQAQAIAAGVKLAGCTVHYVSEEMDAGEIIAQAAIEVLPGDTAASLSERLLPVEHRLYVETVQKLVRSTATAQSS
ncbi:MAG: phosphoribosylglycinamide formyltransferase [Holosporales bacterium]